MKHPSRIEVEKAARSAWRYERENRNLVGRGRAVVISHSLFDRLIAANQDAFILLTVLKLGQGSPRKNLKALAGCQIRPQGVWAPACAAIGS